MGPARPVVPTHPAGFAALKLAGAGHRHSYHALRCTAPPSELRFENTGEIHCSSLSAADWPEFMPHEDKPAGHQPQTGHLEKEEIRLWRLALWFLVLLAIGFAALAWERLQNLPYHLGLVALGLVAVAVLFAVYVYGRRRQVSELRNLLEGLEKCGGAPTSEEQLDQLSQVLARSQRVTQLLRLSYSEIVGHKADEFILEPKLNDAENG